MDSSRSDPVDAHIAALVASAPPLSDETLQLLSTALDSV